MKKFLIALLMSGLPGAAPAADFADLQRLRAGDVGAAKSFEDLHAPAAPAVVPDSELSGFKIKKLDAAGIKDYKITRVGARAPAGAGWDNEPAANFSTRITFGPLTAAQFETLKKSFGGFSRVQYDPARGRWDLTDFLPPLMQALDGKRFVHSALDYAELKPGHPLRPFLDANRLDPNLLMQTNCHATAYEVARSIAAGEPLPRFNAYTLGAITAADVYDAAGGFPDVPDTAMAAPDQAAARNAGRRFGDILVLGPRYGAILHSAVWLDDDLYFEKTDALDNSPYRIVTYGDMLRVPGLASAMNNEMKPGGLRFVRLDPARARRSDELLAGWASLPRPKFNIAGQRLTELGMAPAAAADLYITSFERMGGGNDPALCRIRGFSLEADAARRGRAALPAAAFSDAAFR
ncbi:MAG: hypothetical protein WCK76_10435 [Elusimicrobiota bacterium]